MTTLIEHYRDLPTPPRPSLWRVAGQWVAAGALMLSLLVVALAVVEVVL